MEKAAPQPAPLPCNRRRASRRRGGVELRSTFIHFPRKRSWRPRKISWRTGVTRVNPAINEPCPNRSGALRCKHEALADSDFQLSRGARGLAASAPRCKRKRAPNPLLRSVLPEHADLPPPRASIHVRAQRNFGQLERPRPATRGRPSLGVRMQPRSKRRLQWLPESKPALD